MLSDVEFFGGVPSGVVEATTTNYPNQMPYLRKCHRIHMSILGLEWPTILTRRRGYGLCTKFFFECREHRRRKRASSLPDLDKLQDSSLRGDKYVSLNSRMFVIFEEIFRFFCTQSNIVIVMVVAKYSIQDVHFQRVITEQVF